jgi:hypothetical protein
MRRPKISPQQKQGNAGESLVRFLVDHSKDWIARVQERDFGVDVELEYSAEGFSGRTIKAQVKTSFEDKGDYLAVPVEATTIAYADSSRIPVVLIAVELSTQYAWYAYLQRWILERKKSGSFRENSSTYTIHVPKTQTLECGLNGELKEVADAATHTQFVLALADLLRTARMLKKEDFAKPIIDLIERVDQLAAAIPFKILTDELREYGRLKFLGSADLQNTAALLRDLTLRMGSHITREQIVDLCVKDASCSRIGVNILSALYDTYFGHLSSLGLPTYFREKGNVQLAYFCGLKERFPGIPIVELLVRDDVDLVLEGFGLDFDDHLLDRWANRGDSYVLDLMIPADRLRGDPFALGKTPG